LLWDHVSQGSVEIETYGKFAMDKIKESFEKRTEEEIKSQWHTLKTEDVVKLFYLT
jgi:hypothetical protein